MNMCFALIQCRQDITRDALMHTLYVQFEDCLDLGIYLCKIYQACFNDCLPDRKFLEHSSELLVFFFCFYFGIGVEYEEGVILTLARNVCAQTSERTYLN